MKDSLNWLMILKACSCKIFDNCISMKKPTILLYSDCYTFGGSEYVIVNILKSKYLQSSYNLLFAYRYNKEYNNYIKNIFSVEERKFFYPLRLLTTDNVYYRIVVKFQKHKYIRSVAYHSVEKIEKIANYFGIFELFNNFQINKFLNRNKNNIDIIHINNGGYPAAKSCLIFAICAHRLGIKTFMQINNCAVKSTSKSKFDSEVEDSVSFFLTASNYCKKMLSINRHFNPNKIYSLHNSVDFPVLTKTRKEVLKDLSIKPDAYIISEVALLEYRKGQIPLLKALLALKEINKVLFEKVVLLLVGNGVYEGIIRNFIAENGLSEKVFLLGYRLDYIDIINASDVYVLPSICNEDMPLSILSAMALGKPIVSTNIAGIPEEVSDGINGFLIDPNSASFIKDLGNSLVKVYNHKEEMGLKSLEKFKNEFARNKYEYRLESLYKSIISR